MDKIRGFLLFIILMFTLNAQAVTIEKELLYDQHTLADQYPYNKIERQFQWDKIRNYLALIDKNNSADIQWAVVKNYKNINGIPPLVKVYHLNEYQSIADSYDTERNQSAPLYSMDDTTTPERYARDGLLVKVLDVQGDFYQAEVVKFDGQWLIPKKYLSLISLGTLFNKVIFVDRTNQNITVLEKTDNHWLIRSMNPATTGQHKPPYQYETPKGLFVVQGKDNQMDFLKDGTKELGGFSPYASRFSGGAYIHGVPVNLPSTELVEFSSTLGTTPRSHMCVRNATSHAQFIYDWATINQTLVIVFD